LVPLDLAHSFTFAIPVPYDTLFLATTFNVVNRILVFNAVAQLLKISESLLDH